ncbi:MFS transporter [Candidatus Micrarchaeota archaeon]|nr:MFS transporter [Candidatus Micrarchaeota archaeon]MBD3417485.1 MFS transporter [Candidatus Micrarchaeota archaeon]
MGKEKLSKDTKLLSLNSFFTDISTEMIVPLLPFFITQTLGAPALILGLIEGWAEVSVSLLDMASGWLSDRIKKRRPLVLFGYSLSAVTKPLFAFASSWPQLFMFRFVERMGKGIRRVPRDAMIAATETKAQMGKAFGFRKMMDSAGAMLGPLIAAFLVFHFGGEMPEGEIYRAIFLLAFIPAIIGVALLLLVKEKKEEIAKISSSARVVSKDFSHFLIVAAFFSIAQMGIAFFILKGGEALPLVLVPIAYLAYNAAYTVFAMPAGMLTDALGPKRMLTAAYFLFAIICLLFAFLSEAAMMLALFGALGIFMAIMQTTPRVYLVQTAPGHKYATAIGTYQGVTGLLLLPANLIAGALWEVHFAGAHLPFIISAGIAIIAMLALIFFVKSPLQKRTRTQIS